MIQRYSFPVTCPAGPSVDIKKTPDLDIRPSRMLIHVDRPGLVHLTGIYVNDDQNQIVMPFDGYDFSAQLAEQIRQAFFAEHGLTGKTDDEIDDYLDEHGLDVPSMPRIDLPAINKVGFVRITGAFTNQTVISFIGNAYVPD